eukprot:CAMPEP_0115495684 /NCGR_PEP_ID=MMETSP0271-20121206/65380_1 /TAXON_ID=71861 /ORGANISM="Scrippsiella trochoidea, Strain CCMP3099" /LENGTH=36 /DNA_ID= /DNA_START= /DNA_END= /DNA_ORIENTATION=
MPALMTSAMGGPCSMDKSLRNCCVELNTTPGSSDMS